MSFYNFLKAVPTPRDKGPSNYPPESPELPPLAKKAHISNNEKTAFETLSKSGPARYDKA